LQAVTLFWTGRGIISHRYWMYMGLIMLGRLKCKQQSLWGWCRYRKARRIRVNQYWSNSSILYL